MITAHITGIGFVLPLCCGMGRDFSQTAPQISDAQSENIPDKRGLPKLSPTETLGKPHTRFGRMDDFSRVSLSAVAFAIRDAGLETREERLGAGIFAASYYGCLQTDADYTLTMADSPSPGLFAYTLPNTFIGEASIIFNLTGPGIAIQDENPFSSIALKTALAHMHVSGDQAVIAGASDIIPDGLESNRARTINGGLYFTLEKNRAKDRSYGKIEYDGKGLRFNNSKTDNLSSIKESCIKTLEAKQK